MIYDVLNPKLHPRSDVERPLSVIKGAFFSLCKGPWSEKTSQVQKSIVFLSGFLGEAGNGVARVKEF